MAFNHKPSLTRLILSIALILSSFVLDVICFTPLPRFEQTSALINNKIYFMGGNVSLPDPIISDFFYLDTSVLNSTDSTTLPWTELTGLDNLFTSSGTAVAGGANKDLFVLFGGRMTPVDNSSLVIVYDTNNNTWSEPVISVSQDGASEPQRRKQTQAVVDGSGKMYIFGGSFGPDSGQNYLNDMVILDTVNWIWSTGSQNGAPEPRNDFTATILNSGVAVYIGGSDLNSRYIPMSQIHLYDTTADSWSKLDATGDIPNPRGGHSAVLTSDGRIIIYGGAISISADGKYTAASPDLAVLDTNNNNFVWSQPKANGTAPPPIAYHSASIIGDNMIVSFGNITNKGPSSDIYVLNTKDSNYGWITSINPADIPAASPDTTTSSGSSGLSSTATAGIVVGVILGLIVLGGVLFLLYRYKRNRKMMEGVIETPGEFTDGGFSRRYETMNSTTTSQISHDHSKHSSTDFDHSREFTPSVQDEPEVEDDKEFKVLPQELQPEYLEKKYGF